MAKIKEEVVIIKLSKLVKNLDDIDQLTNDDFETNLEAIVQELVGDAIIVEIERE
jgi:hypothetical protein